MRRVLTTVLAGTLLLGGCATQSDDAKLVEAYDTLVAEANTRDPEGLRSAVDAFIELVHRQEGGALTTAEAERLVELAKVIKQRAAQVSAPGATPTPTPTPQRTQDQPPPTQEPDEDEDEGDGEDEGKASEGASASSSPPPRTARPEPTSDPEPTAEITIGSEPSPEPQTTATG